MFNTFARLGRRDLKTLAKHLHAALEARREPLDLAACRDLVAQLHGHASWHAAKANDPAATPAFIVNDVGLLGQERVQGFLGTARMKEVRLSAQEQRMHRLMFGCTGSGITESTLSMLMPAMATGQGIVMLDTYGDASLALKLTAMARATGRLADLRLVHLWQGGSDTIPDEWLRYNPLEQATLAELRLWLYPYMTRTLNDEDTFASGLLDAVLTVLLAGRDAGWWPLDFRHLAQALQWEHLQALRTDPRLLPIHRQQLTEVLARLPDAQPASYARYEALFLQELPQAHFEAFSARVVKGLWQGAELDVRSALTQQQIVLVSLPSLEKSSRDLANLGRMFLSHVFQQIQSLSASGELPATHRAMWAINQVDFLLDETIVALAEQGQNWGVTLLASAMNYDGLKHHFPSLVERFVQAMDIRLFMKTEGSDTAALLEQGISQEPRKDLRGLALDLREQYPGEAHLLLASRLHRVKLAYYHVPESYLRDSTAPCPTSPWRQVVSGRLP